GTKGNVIGRAVIRFKKLLQIVGGDSEHSIRADNEACPLGREVVLADVDAVISGSQTDVGSIVHDQAYVLSQGAPKLAGVAEHLARAAYLVAVLDEGCAPSEQIARVLHDGRGSAQRRRKAGDIDDGVQLGKFHGELPISPQRQGDTERTKS